MNSGHNSERLRRKIELVLPDLAAAGEALMNHPRIAALYPEYLFSVHSMIRASVPLMEAAVGRARALASADLVAAGVAAYLAKHIPEELHHDEWVLDDLEILGASRATILQRPPSATVAAMVGSQYYWIFHYHPVALLGYIAVMEGYPPTVPYLDDLVARTGHPRRAFRTLFKHAQLDPHHRDDLNRALDTLPLAPEHWAIVGLSALQTVQFAACALKEIAGRRVAQAA